MCIWNHLRYCVMSVALLLIMMLPKVLSRTAPDQYGALHSLYNQTDGANWNFKMKPWNFTHPNDPCDEKWEVSADYSESEYVLI